MSIWTRLTALGFALGSSAHAVAFVLLFRGIQLYGPGYPPWRHVAMSVVDASIAWIALQRTSWLLFALLAFLAEQVVVNRQFDATVAFVLVAAGFASWEKWLRRSRTDVSASRAG